MAAVVYQGDCKHARTKRFYIRAGICEFDEDMKVKRVVQESAIVESETGLLESCLDCGAARYIPAGVWYADGFADGPDD